MLVATVLKERGNTVPGRTSSLFLSLVIPNDVVSFHQSLIKLRCNSITPKVIANESYLMARGALC
jgi:hypothetical protein